MSEELKTLLVQVITSWQVIGITVALLLFLSMVFYITDYDPSAKMHNIPRPKPPAPKKEKKAAAPEPDAEEDMDDLESA
ncbi:MAG: hypothetical protein LBD24_09535 [Spirochaetaceae bacterium]|jgi:hypothetical protein|nr:hypothetical protein [Spirochaetaceae bacterium]